MNPDTPFGPWRRGIDNVSSPTSLLADQYGRTVTLRDAVNVDVDRDGHVSRRRGRALVLPRPGAHSLRSTSQGAFFAAGAQLYRIDTPDAPFAALNSDDPCDYAELDSAVVVSNRTTLLRVRDGSVHPLGVPVSEAPLLAPTSFGALHAGRYGVAVSFVRGDEEGALSPVVFAAVLEGGGLQLDGLAAPEGAEFARVYRTTGNGDALFYAVDVPAGMTSWALGNDALGKEPPFPNMTRMLPGRFVTTWRGRLVTAQGRTLRFSEPLAYGVTSLRHNFVQAPHRITMLQGMSECVYVGTTHGVWLLRGTGPRDASWVRTSAAPPAEGCYAVVSASALEQRKEIEGENVVVWLSANGFALGTDSGHIMEPQAGQLAVSVGSSGALAYGARRVTAVVS